MNLPPSTIYAVLLALVLGVGCGKKESDVLELKDCYYCKESDVKYLAVICKHCGEDPDGPNGKFLRLEMTKIANDERRQQLENQKKWTENTLEEWLSGLLIFGGSIFLFWLYFPHQYRTGQKELAEKERTEEARANSNRQTQDTE